MLFSYWQSAPEPFTSWTYFHIIRPTIREINNELRKLSDTRTTWSHWLSTIFKKKDVQKTFAQSIEDCDFIYWNGIRYDSYTPKIAIYHELDRLDDVITFMGTLSCTPA
jgi:hypothetical protein